MIILEGDQITQGHISEYWRAERELKAGAKDLSPKALTDALVVFVGGMKGLGVDKEQFNTLAREYVATLRWAKAAAEELTPAEYTGVVAQAAIRAGIVKEMAEDDVMSMAPHACADLVNKVQKAIRAAYEVPGE